jgi:hypothetical protein
MYEMWTRVQIPTTTVRMQTQMHPHSIKQHPDAARHKETRCRLKFYLGTHMVNWLWDSNVPLFVSNRRLIKYKKFRQASCNWSLDSGGFTELSMFGEWRTSPHQYIAKVRKYYDEIGNLDWASQQDAMCEPWILEKCKNWLGGTVQAHQLWTVENYLTLATLAPDLPIIPVLQGWVMDDYHRHVELFYSRGIELHTYPTVGLGSVCRRQSTNDIGRIANTLKNEYQLSLHGFGVKSGGINKYGKALASADSMAWSFGGRRIFPCPQSDRANCANCRHHALEWRAALVRQARQNNICIEPAFIDDIDEPFLLTSEQLCFDFDY